MSPSTLPELLDDTAARHPDVEAFVHDGRRCTFAELAVAADEVATVLTELGVTKGDVVCVSLPSSIDFAICYHAAMRIGAITSAVNPRLGQHEIADIERRTDPVVTISLDWPGARTPAELHAARRAATEVDRRARPVVDRDDLVAVIWTSGSTGRPKGAMFDHARLEAMAAAMGDLSRPFDRRLASVPFAHTGFMGRVWDTVGNAICEVIVPTPWRAHEALRLIESERVTVCQGVPTQWSLMLADPDLDDIDLASLRATSIGAAAASPTLIAAIRDRMGAPVLVGYASTETGTISRTRLDDPPEVALATVGRAERGVDLEIVDEDDRALPVGAIGSVRCRSAGSMVGYWDEAASEAPGSTDTPGSTDGWVRTGDLGWLDEDGNLHLTGRSKEMYIRGGYNIYPAEVESALAAHPAVASVAVVAAPDPVLGEVGVAFVVRRPAAAATGEDLRTWCREQIADYKTPDLVRFVDELPVTPVGKVDKRALTAQAGDAADVLAQRRTRTTTAEAVTRSEDDD